MTSFVDGFVTSKVLPLFAEASHSPATKPADFRSDLLFKRSNKDVELFVMFLSFLGWVYHAAL